MLPNPESISLVNYEKKIQKADSLLEELKDELSLIVWETDLQSYNNHQYLIPLLGEQSKNEIRKLKLNTNDQEIYFVKVDRLLGVYHDDFPSFKDDNG